MMLGTRWQSAEIMRIPLRARAFGSSNLPVQTGIRINGLSRFLSIGEIGRKMKKVILALFALVTALAISPVASAQTYNFSFSSIPYSGSGVFEVTGGVITGLTGTFYSLGVDVGAMTMLAPGTFAGNDNVFAPAPNYVTLNGLSFIAGGAYFNIFNFTTTYPLNQPKGCAVGGDSIAYRATSQPGLPLTFFNVPEYGTLSMLILSALTLAGGIFVKSRQSGLFLAA
jgi:hypothetical protein